MPRIRYCCTRYRMRTRGCFPRDTPPTQTAHRNTCHTANTTDHRTALYHQARCHRHTAPRRTRQHTRRSRGTPRSCSWCTLRRHLYTQRNSCRTVGMPALRHQETSLLGTQLCRCDDQARIAPQSTPCIGHSTRRSICGSCHGTRQCTCRLQQRPPKNTLSDRHRRSTCIRPGTTSNLTLLDQCRTRRMGRRTRMYHRHRHCPRFRIVQRCTQRLQDDGRVSTANTLRRQSACLPEDWKPPTRRAAVNSANLIAMCGLRREEGEHDHERGANAGDLPPRCCGGQHQKGTRMLTGAPSPRS